MRPLLFGVLINGSVAFAAGSGLEEVRAALATFTGKEPAQASVAIARWERATGEKTKEASAGANFYVSATKTAVSVSCNEGLLVPAPMATKGEPAEVLRTIISSTDLFQASRWMNHAPVLLQQLEEAEVLEAKDTTFEEKPARVLKLKLKTEHRGEGAAEATTTRAMTLWVDAEHRPLASESTTDASGGVMVVKFEARSKTDRKYTRVGDRLVVLEATEQSSTSSLGRTFQNKQTVKLTVK